MHPESIAAKPVLINIPWSIQRGNDMQRLVDYIKGTHRIDLLDGKAFVVEARGCVVVWLGDAKPSKKGVHQLVFFLRTGSGASLRMYRKMACW